MSTPLNSQISQAIDIYTHAFAAQLPPTSCTLAYRIKGGNTSYASLSGTTLTLASILPADVDSHSITIEAYYATYIDSVAPTQTHEQTIQVTIEPACNIVSFSPS